MPLIPQRFPKPLAFLGHWVPSKVMMSPKKLIPAAWSHLRSNQKEGLHLYTRNGLSVKVASPREAKKFLRMRSVIFGKEYRGNRLKVKKDTDDYDERAQQIILVHRDSQTILGGCRVIMSSNIEDYYCHLEYDIEALMSLPGDKLEVSRVCIHPKYRDGKNFTLLWRGLLVYGDWLGVDYVFGIPSIKTTSREDTEKFYKMCQDLGYVGPTLGITRPEFLRYSSSTSLSSISEDQIPTLMRLYLSAGSKVCSQGAVDHDLKCIDYLTVLKMSELHPRYRKWQESSPRPHFSS